MPPQALVAPGAASRVVWSGGIDDGEFPRSAASVPHHRRNAEAPATVASEGVASFGTGGGTAQKGNKRTRNDGRETACDVPYAFRGNPLAPFVASENAADEAHDTDRENFFPSETRVRESLESAALSGAVNAKLASTAETALQRLTDLASIPVGSLLLGVVAEVHSDDILVHLPDGLVGWVPRAHAFPSAEEDSPGCSISGDRESVSVCAKRYRKGAARCTAEEEGNEASPRAATEGDVDVSGGKDTRKTAPKRHAPRRAARRVEASVSLTSHYIVGQVVQCAVIAEGGNEWPQTPGRLGRGDGQTLVLSLRPSIFNAGLTVETVKPGMVLPASLTSVEDHGYAFSLGVKGLSAFLPSSGLQCCPSVGSAAPRAEGSSASAIPLSLPLRTIVSLRVDSVNAAAKVLLCSLPGTPGQGRRSSESKAPLSRQQQERYLALDKAVAWAAVKPGCLVEARVQHLYKCKGRAEKSTCVGSSTGLGEEPKSPSPNGSEKLNETASQNATDVVGVRVACMGGDVVGTLLQPHFGHPLLGLHDSVCPDLQSCVAADTGSGDHKRRTKWAGKAADEGGHREGQGGKGLGPYSGCSSETCAGTGGAADVEVGLPRKEGGTLSHTANGSAQDGGRFELIQARYSQACASRLTRVGARIFARVTCVLSSGTRHVYLSMLPHIMKWRPCQLPCSVTDLLPGRRLLAQTARVISVFPGTGILSQKTSTLKRHPSSSSHAGGLGGGEVRVLLQKRFDKGASQENKLGHQKKKIQPCARAERGSETSRSHSVDESSLRSSSEDVTEGYAERRALSSHTSAGCEVDCALSTGEACVCASGEQGQSCPWVLVKIPRCMMATAIESTSAERRQRSGGKRRVSADAKAKRNEETALLSGMVPGDILWSTGTDEADCFCRVLYFDRFAAEVVGGTAPRLIRDTVVLTPYDVSPGQIITASVVRWRLPVESNKIKHDRGERRVQGPPPGIVVRLSPFLTAFVPLYQLMDTPVSFFPPHLVPGSSLKLRVLERVCCRSCSSLDRDAVFAPFITKSGQKRTTKGQSVRGSTAVSSLQCLYLRGDVALYSDERAFGSAVMGMGGGGGGRLVLTGKKSFLRDPHPLTCLVAPSSSGGRVLNGQGGQTCYLHLGLIALGYVKDVIDKDALRDVCSGRNGMEGSEERLPSLTVGFYGGLTARLSHDEVRRAVMEEGRTFKLGTIVKVRVLGVDANRRCLRVTMDMSSEVIQAAVAAARRRKEQVALRLCPGAIVEKQRLTLLALTEEGVFVAVEEKKGGDAAHAPLRTTELIGDTRTTDATAKSCVDTSQGGEHEYPPVVGLGFIPKMHLSDGVRLAEELYGLLQVGKKFPLDAVVLSSAATVRPGAAVQIWEPLDVPVKEENIHSRKGSTVRAVLGHSEGGIEDVLVRVKRAVLQLSTVERDGLEKEDAVEALIRDVNILSCKPSLRVSATNGTFLRDSKALEKLKTKLRSSPPILWGYVRKIGAYGLLVSFGAWHLTGLLPYSNISDTFIEDGSHLRQLYREGMTVRGCLVAVSDAADEECEQDPSAHANTSTRIMGATGKRGALRFLVDIRPKRVSDLQRHQRLEGGARAAAFVGIQVLQGLFEQKTAAAMLKQLRNMHERLAETVVARSPEADGRTLEKATFTSNSTGDSGPSDNMASAVSLRPGQLVWGRILPQDFPNCVLLELQWPSRQHSHTCSRPCFHSIKGVTGVVLEHQLPEGETTASMRATAGERGCQNPMPCVVLDFDPVTGIADVSCRTHLVKPLQVAHNVVEAAAGHKKSNYVHYILVGVSTLPSSDQEATGLHGTSCKGEGTGGHAAVKQRRAEVVTEEVNGLLHGNTAVLRSHFEISGALPSAVRTSHVKAGRIGSEPKGTQQKKEEFLSQPVDAIPEKVIQRVHSFCEAQPVPCATVQLESATYSVLSADFDLVIYFSKNRRLRQERLEALVSYAAHAGSGGETAQLLHVTPDGSVVVDTSQSRKSGTPLTGSSYLADGLFVRLPLLLFSTSCHNNSLLPVQPTADALQEAPEDAGWRVALSPVQRSLCMQSGTFGVSVLLSGGCWPMRECRLEQQRHQKKTPSQRHARVKGTDDFGERTDSAELRKNKRSAEKELSASELDDAIERAAAPGQILRAKVTHVGASVALARLKTPKQQLLLRLHAADALSVSLQIQHPVEEADSAVYERKVVGHALSQGEDRDREDRECPKKETQPPGGSENEPGETPIGEEQHCERDSGRILWFPPVLSQPTSSTGRSPSVSNPLRRLNPGMLVDVKVLRLREVHSLPCERAGNAGLLGAARALKACDERSARNCEDGKEDTHTKNKPRCDTVRSTKNQWVADVELVGLIEKRKAAGGIVRTRYTHVSSDVSASLTSCFTGDAERVSGKVAKSQCGSGMTRNMLAWLYSPRWAVVEAVCDRYLTVHCGVRSEVLGSLFLQQPIEIDSKGNELTKSSPSREGIVYAAAYLSGRGRVHRLDASWDRRVLKDLRVGFAPGDMVCVRLLPVLTLEEAAFEEALECVTGAARRADDETTREDGATPDIQHCRRNTRRNATFVARYTLVGTTAHSEEELTQYAAHAEEELTTYESRATTSAHTVGTIPFSLVETSFDTMARALDAWAYWRYNPGIVCWGVVHHMLPPPFALAVQVSEVVVRRHILPFLNNKYDSGGGRDYTQIHNEEDEQQPLGMNVISGDTRDSAAHVPVLAAVHLTEIMDSWQSDPVKHLKLRVGQLVKVRIMPILKAQHAQQELKHKKTESRSGLPLEASMRLSVVEEVCRLKPRTGDKHNRLLTFDQLKVGERVSGYVISTGDAGVFVAISRCLTLRIKLQNLCGSTEALHEELQRRHSTVYGLVTGAQARELYPVGKALQGIILVEVDPDSRRVEGSLKDEAAGATKRRSSSKEETSANKRPKNKTVTKGASLALSGDPVVDTLACSDLDVGDDCEGRVKRVESFGVFVSLLMPPTRLFRGERTADALCHVSDIGGTTKEERSSRLGKLKIGDLVKARVIRTDKVTGRIWITLDMNVYNGEEKSKGDLDDMQAQATWGELGKCSEPFGRMTSTLKGTAVGEDVNEEQPQSSIENAPKECSKTTESHYAVEQSSCSWSAAVSGFEDVSDEGCEGYGEHFAERQSAVVRGGQRGPDLIGQGLNRSEDVEEISEDASERRTNQDQEEQRRKKEEEIRLAEEENSYRSWMENPRTPEDFEKLILVSGNSATVWIGYMAYYLKLGDLARARQVAERAVAHINYREEQQRLDVWVAYLNMECVYGDALETIFKRAIQYNDAKKIYYQMTFIFEKAQKLEEARSACESCCSRFPESQKMWVRHLTLLYTSFKDLSAARELMLQALLRLPRRKHVAFAASCARLEYKYGSKERGQTYFEKLLAEHPKRTDLWSQYMDAHIAANTPPRCQRADLQSIRLLFERSTSLHLKPRKMKFLFTRWLLFEKQHGTADGQSLVRARAREYIQTMEAKLVELQQS